MKTNFLILLVIMIWMTGIHTALSNDSLFWVLPHTEVYQINGGSFSRACRIPGNTGKYQRAEYLITKGEITGSGLPAGSVIRNLGFWNMEAVSKFNFTISQKIAFIFGWATMIRIPDHPIGFHI